MTLDLKLQLEKAVDIVKDLAPVDLIILFGSTARGEYVSDITVEGHVTYEYQSDFDLLIVVQSEKVKNDIDLWSEIKAKLSSDPQISVPVSLVVDTFNFVSKKILDGNYFYVDIKREGKILFDSGVFELPDPKGLTIEKQKELADSDLAFWTGKARDFLRDYEHNINDNSLNNAAFHLSQAAESLYFAALLVFTGYKPKSHNLEKIEEAVSELIPDIAKAFPRVSSAEKELFGLLTRAYIDARYKQDYTITKSQLDYLHKNVLQLKELVFHSCKEKINSL